MWFALLFLIVTTVAFPTSSPPSSSTTSFIYDSALGFACHSNTNCGGLVGNSMCLNGICACQSGYIPEGIMRCIYAAGKNNFLTNNYPIIEQNYF